MIFQNESALQSTLAVFNMQIHVVHLSKIEHRDYTIRQDHRLSAEALLCLKGPQKYLKFVPDGFCLLVKVFLEFKNGLGFFLPFPEHEIPKLA